MYTCDICNFASHRKSKLDIHNNTKKHINRKNLENGNVLNKCIYCTKIFNRKDNLQRHLKTGCKNKKVAQDNNNEYNNIEDIRKQNMELKIQLLEKDLQMANIEIAYLKEKVEIYKKQYENTISFHKKSLKAILGLIMRHE